MPFTGCHRHLHDCVKDLYQSLYKCIHVEYLIMKNDGERTWTTLLLSSLLFASLIIDYVLTLYFSGGDLLNGEVSPILRYATENGFAIEWVIVSSTTVTFIIFSSLLYLQRYDNAYTGAVTITLLLSVSHILAGLSWYLKNTMYSNFIFTLSLGLISSSIFLFVAFMLKSHWRALLASTMTAILLGVLAGAFILPGITETEPQPVQRPLLATWEVDFIFEKAGDAHWSNWTDDHESTTVYLTMKSDNLTTLSLRLEWEDDTSNGEEFAGEKDTLSLRIEAPDGQIWKQSSDNGSIEVLIAVNDVPSGFTLTAPTPPDLSPYGTSNGTGTWRLVVTVEDSPGNAQYIDLDDGNSWDLYASWISYRGFLRSPY